MSSFFERLIAAGLKGMTKEADKLANEFADSVNNAFKKKKEEPQTIEVEVIKQEKK